MGWLSILSLLMLTLYVPRHTIQPQRFYYPRKPPFFCGQLEESKVRDFADSQVPVRPCLVPSGRSC